MNKVVPLLKGFAKALGALLAAVVALAVLKFYVMSPRKREAPAMKAPSSPEAIERGRYLVENVAGCIGCHSPVREDVPGEPPVEGKIGAGRDFGVLDPKSPAHLRGPNITPDPTTGLGAWTDGEIARAVREGIGRDGRVLFPQMPYRTYGQTLGDGEMLDIIAYLRSLPPITHDVGRTDVRFPVSMFVRTAPMPLGSAPAPAPSPSDKLGRGRWLLRTASCNDCHDSIDEHMQKIEGKPLGGGFRFPLGARGLAIAPNISSDRTTGVGAYSDEDLLRAIEEGKGKDGRTLYAMPWTYYRGMTREDKEALIAALRQVPAVSNLVPRSNISP
jgi:mono/diheme cytochrome c family protein